VPKLLAYISRSERVPSGSVVVAVAKPVLFVMEYDQ
jgi:hypothetical protein